MEEMDISNLSLSDEQLRQLAQLLVQQSSDKLNKEDWKNKLTTDSKGKVKNDIDNYILFLENDERYKGKIKYNEFLQQPELNGQPFKDTKISVCMNDCERIIGLSTKQKFDNAIDEVLEKNHYNPVQDYLKGLKWDGEKRIENVFIKLLEADDSEINRIMSKKWFMAAVKRVMIPGCKFDNILVFQGAQGIGKSTICERISKGFYNNIYLSNINDKDMIDKLNKTWIGIIDELDAFNKKDMTSIKTFLSTSIDSTRLAYGRYTQSFKRHCVFIGSINDETFLRDSTSLTERRFWVIKCYKKKYTPIVNELLTNEYVDQLWAEAYYELYKDINQYLDIETQYQEEFSKTMSQFKTYKDDSVIDYINDILNGKYKLRENGQFIDVKDFLDQCNGDRSYDDNITQKINKIPMSYIKHVLKIVYKEDRSSKYIAYALSRDWEYKAIGYNSSTYMGLYRKNQIINNIEKKYDESLPF